MNRRFLGVDYGDRVIGVAVSDPTGTIATPLTRIAIAGAGGEEAVDRLVLLVQNEEASGVVLGDPRHMRGTPSAGSAVVRGIASELVRRLDLPVWLWDERLSTVAAARALREGGVKKRAFKERVDVIAACLILQGFLDAHHGRPLPPGIPPLGPPPGTGDASPIDPIDR